MRLQNGGDQVSPGTVSGRRIAMPFYEGGPVRIHYEEVGSAFPLLLIPGGGLNSALSS